VVDTAEAADCFVDDLIDSGRTRDIYKEMYPETPFAVLIQKNGEWIHFWFEKEFKQDAEELVIRTIEMMGDNPARPGLKDTPRRVTEMWEEIFGGYHEEQKPKITTFVNGSDGITYDQMIVDNGAFYSHCEHHMLPFIGNYWFAYIPSPKGKLLGLSKVARVVDYHSAKLQIQERLTQDVVNELWTALCVDGEEPLGMALVMKAEHLCKTMRGAKKKGMMTTIELKGAMKDKPEARSEFLRFVNGGRE
jgi:GTP cyclohydrolase I